MKNLGQKKERSMNKARCSSETISGLLFRSRDLRNEHPYGRRNRGSERVREVVFSATLPGLGWAVSKNLVRTKPLNTPPANIGAKMEMCCCRVRVEDINSSTIYSICLI